MAELTRICPYYKKPCAEARDELHLIGQECDFITNMLTERPSLVAGAPPTLLQSEVCIIRSFQQSLNGLNQNLAMLLKSVSMPFGKG